MKNIMFLPMSLSFELNKFLKHGLQRTMRAYVSIQGSHGSKIKDSLTEGGMKGFTMQWLASMEWEGGRGLHGNCCLLLTKSRLV